MATTVEMVTEACGGSSSDLLIQLTNTTGRADSINSTVLAAAATKAEGTFRRETGVAPDADADWQQGALLAGTLYWLEFVKGRDADLIKTRRETMNDELKAIRAKVALGAYTNSTLTPPAERSGQRADLDRDGFVGTITDGKTGVSDPYSRRSPGNDSDVSI